MTERARYWAELAKACETSKLTQAEFCRQRGINHGTFAWWKHQLGRRAKPAVVRPRAAARKAQPFVELRLAGAASVPGYEVVLRGGRSIRVPSSFDPQALTRLIEVVESC